MLNKKDAERKMVLMMPIYIYHIHTYDAYVYTGHSNKHVTGQISQFSHFPLHPSVSSLCPIHLAPFLPAPSPPEDAL